MGVFPSAPALVGWVMATLMVELDWSHHHNCNYQMPGFKITRDHQTVARHNVQPSIQAVKRILPTLMMRWWWWVRGLLGLITPGNIIYVPSQSDQPQQGESNIWDWDRTDRTHQHYYTDRYIFESERNIYPWSEHADRKQQKQRII